MEFESHTEMERQQTTSSCNTHPNTYTLDKHNLNTYVN